ncbi:MAG: hypothetical protein EOO03_04045 [Chitinophagaceae bacterium]|nr:MAG: hypothetical protein EOO03_04045 [Chitinophagaceae bacterium]
MKQILQITLLALFFSACGSNKAYLERTDENKALFDAVKRLNKKSTDEEALQAVPILYASVLKTKLAKVASYETGGDIGRWDKILNEYNDLQELYEAIINSPAAFKLLSPRNFNTELLETQDGAAAAYYQEADELLNNGGRDNAKKAYSYFKKTDKYVPGYKEVRVKMNQAYEDAIVDVVINPVQDNSFFTNTGWGRSGLDYSNEYFQRSLVRDLSYENANRNYAARFYSDWEAQRANVAVDWVVDLRLRNMDFAPPQRTNYSQNRSAQIHNGTDTSGKPIYKTVTARVNITRLNLTARADMDVLIKDLENNRIINSRNFREDYRWQEQQASFTGDSRALNQDDWNMINNNNFNAMPARDRVLEELYRKLYPQVLNNIKYAVSW